MMPTDMEIRRLTDQGLQAFCGYLANLRAGADTPPPYHLLTGPNTSEVVENSVIIQNRAFKRRLEAAEYFDDVLTGLEIGGIETDVHLWSWLSLYYFDQVCPPDQNARRRPGRDYRHILEPGYRYGHNHLLCGAFLVCTVHGLGYRLSALLLYTPPFIESGFHHQLAGRQNIISNRGIMEAAYLLYYDENSGRPKRGSFAKANPGNLYRFIDVLQQFDLTYDLFSMRGYEIISILPSEFDRWKE